MSVSRSDHDAGDRPAFPPSVFILVRALACELPHEHGLPLWRLSIPEIRREAVERGLIAAVGITTVWRWLTEDAIRPWAHRSWIFPRDPAFTEKAERVLELYEGFWEGQSLTDGDFVVSTDEKTSIQARARVRSTVRPSAGQPMLVEHEYKRRGAWTYVAAWDVRRAKIFGRCEPKTGKLGQFLSGGNKCCLCSTSHFAKELSMTSLRQRMLEYMQVRNLFPHTQESYVQQVSLFARYFRASREGLGPEEIRAYQIYLTNEKKLATGSIGIAVSALQFLYTVTLHKDWSVQEVIPAPKTPQKLPVVLSPEEVHHFLGSVANPKHRTILTTCYAAGLRVSEATRLKPTEIDSRRMVIRVDQGKGCKDRYVMLSPQLMEILRVKIDSAVILMTICVEAHLGLLLEMKCS